MANPLTEYGKKYATHNQHITETIAATGLLDFLQTVKKGQQQDHNLPDDEAKQINENIGFLGLRAREICIAEQDNLYNLSLRCALLEQHLVTTIESMLTIAKLK